MNCYRCGDPTDSDGGLGAQCPTCGLGGEKDTSDSMCVYTWGFLDTEPPVPEGEWEVLPEADWVAGGAPALAVKIAGQHSATHEPVIARLPGSGWCVLTLGLLEVPLRWQEDKKRVIVWSEEEAT